jgi:alkylation response protein AidB-like acyl-CoA dehydrogenase
MLREALTERLRDIIAGPMPRPGSGETPTRHLKLMSVAREDVSLARLAEAHWDATAILAEAGHAIVTGVLYAVWASEKPGQSLSIRQEGDDFVLTGTKPFCSGAGIVDRALVTVSKPEQRLVDVDLRINGGAISYDSSDWKTSAFSETNTSSVHFQDVHISGDELVGEPHWYLRRPGFWHGACGPAACWAGGAIGLVDYALLQSRQDPHTLAHLGAMHASVWALYSILEKTGREIDETASDVDLAMVRALTVRHLVEQECTDILRRLARAYGPHPLAMDEPVARRYQELDLYLRQSHAERDLESLGKALRKSNKTV